MWIFRYTTVTILLVSVWMFQPQARAQGLPSGFAITELVPSSVVLWEATTMAVADDGRIFIAMKTGDILVWTPQSGLLAQPFHTFSVNASRERGLVGLAIDPEFATNRRIFAYYTRAGPPSTAVLVHLTASVANPNVADPLSETPILELGVVAAEFHVGGALHFGQDGKLYLAVGDNTVTQNAQSLTSYFGKILRINRDGTPAQDNPPSISGIPGTTEGIYRAIWAAGLRNPYTFAFESGTGRMYINDVGAGSWEEVNEGGPGRNFGWPSTEGDFNASEYPAFTRPVYALSHEGRGAAIVGGAFYRPLQHTFPPDYHRDYFFNEFIYDTMYRLDSDTGQRSNFANIVNVVNMIVEPSGSLLVLTRQAIYFTLSRIQYTAPLAPSFLAAPAAQYAVAGNDVDMTCYVAGNRPLTYTWYRDGAVLEDGGRFSGTTTAEVRISGVECDDRGAYTVQVTNAAGAATSDSATLAVNTLCRGDFNCDGGVDGSDVETFFVRWEAGFPSADINDDGGVDGADLEAFFLAWENGC